MQAPTWSTCKPGFVRKKCRLPSRIGSPSASTTPPSTPSPILSSGPVRELPRAQGRANRAQRAVAQVGDVLDGGRGEDIPVVHERLLKGERAALRCPGRCATDGDGPFRPARRCARSQTAPTKIRRRSKCGPRRSWAVSSSARSRAPPTAARSTSRPAARALHPPFHHARAARSPALQWRCT
jgi:hypothetical protein